jgi:2'-5' RNA ligase
VRAFIGTLLSAANQDVSDSFGARIADASRGALRPVPPRSSHITHMFLGDVDDALVEIVTADLEELLRSVAPVPFRLGRLEILGARREPRLVLANAESEGAGISGVTQRILDRLRRHAGLAQVLPARSPHVTLARFRRGAGADDARWVTDWLRGAGTEALWQEDRLEEVQFLHSELTPSGPIYTVVARAPAGRQT